MCSQSGNRFSANEHKSNHCNQQGAAASEHVPTGTPTEYDLLDQYWRLRLIQLFKSDAATCHAPTDTLAPQYLSNQSTCRWTL